MQKTYLLLTSLIVTNSLANALNSKSDDDIDNNQGDLLLGKVCPVFWQQTELGILAFSQPWYHNGGTQASYQARDDATGVGLEIHFLANNNGHTSKDNRAQCHRYRVVQTRYSTALHGKNTAPLQLDIPSHFELPFYDNQPLEFGRGSHLTPNDDRDKPWLQRHSRASSVAIYDTPYVSDYYGKEGANIRVEFETCVLCQRDDGYDLLLSCGKWGFEREYMDTMTGWSEPEFIAVQCHNQASSAYLSTLDSDDKIDYQYWLDWR